MNFILCVKKIPAPGDSAYRKRKKRGIWGCCEDNKEDENTFGYVSFLSRLCWLILPTDGNVSQPSPIVPSTTTNRIVVPARLLVKRKDLLNLEKVGGGAQGEVYRAQWKGNTVTYKQMKLVDAREEFMEEFNVWQYYFSWIWCYEYWLYVFRQASHPSCVLLYGIVDEDTEFGFVAEYCVHGSLYHYS